MASKKEPTSVADTKGSSNPGLNDPYLDARREWNERYGSYISRAKNWRLMAFGVLGVCLCLRHRSHQDGACGKGEQAG